MTIRAILIAAGLAVAVGVSFAPVAISAAGRPDVSGIWLTQAGDAKIAISRCEAGICGRIVWLKEPIDRATGKPQVDDKNPNPSLAKRRIIGLSIFSDMKAAAYNSWSGRIYNADNGKTYPTTVTLQDDNTLKVNGCAGPFCGSETWSKVGKL